MSKIYILYSESAFESVLPKNRSDQGSNQLQSHKISSHGTSGRPTPLRQPEDRSFSLFKGR
jgi:hypothetical protein